MALTAVSAAPVCKQLAPRMLKNRGVEAVDPTGLPSNEQKPKLIFSHERFNFFEKIKRPLIMLLAYNAFPVMLIKPIGSKRAQRPLPTSCVSPLIFGSEHRRGSKPVPSSVLSGVITRLCAHLRRPLPKTDSNSFWLSSLGSEPAHCASPKYLPVQVAGSGPRHRKRTTCAS